MKSAPKSPDPVETANAQAQYNMQAAQQQFGLNAINQSGPYGSTAYNQIGTWEDGTPRYEQVTSLNAGQQGLLDSATQAQTGLANLANQATGQLSGLISNPVDFSNRDAETWAYDLASPRILAQQGQNETQLRTTLANKGIREGSAAWNAEMSRLTNANTDQMNQLALTGRQQSYNEAMGGRQQTYNELAGLLGGAAVSPQNPTSGYAATPQVGVNSVDYSGLVNSNYQNELNSYNSKLGGIGGLFGTIAGGPIGGAIAGKLF